jgi:hypothetical protein
MRCFTRFLITTRPLGGPSKNHLASTPIFMG